MMYEMLLAEVFGPQERLRAMQRHLRSRDSDPTLWWGLLLVVALGALVFLALYSVQRLQHHQRTSHHGSAGRLFQEVMQKLQLPFSDRILLRRVARGLALKNPASILVSPSTLRWAAHRWAGPDALGGAGRNEEVQRLIDISRRIFGRPFVPLDPNSPVAAEPPEDEGAAD